MHTIQPLPLSRCRCNAICVDIHLNWRMERCPSHCEQCAQHSLLLRTTSRYITKKTKNGAIFQKENANFCRIRLHHEKNQKGAILIPKEECKLLPQNPKKHFFGIFLEFIKIGIPKKLSTLRQNFFANFFCIFFFGIHQDLVRICFFLEILPDEATCFAILPPYILMCMN